MHPPATNYFRVFARNRHASPFYQSRGEPPMHGDNLRNADLSGANLAYTYLAYADLFDAPYFWDVCSLWLPLEFWILHVVPSWTLSFDEHRGYLLSRVYVRQYCTVFDYLLSVAPPPSHFLALDFGIAKCHISYMPHIANGSSSRRRPANGSKPTLPIPVFAKGGGIAPVVDRRSRIDEARFPDPFDGSKSLSTTEYWMPYCSLGVLPEMGFLGRSLSWGDLVMFPEWRLAGFSYAYDSYSYDEYATFLARLSRFSWEVQYTPPVKRTIASWARDLFPVGSCPRLRVCPDAVSSFQLDSGSTVNAVVQSCLEYTRWRSIESYISSFLRSVHTGGTAKVAVDYSCTRTSELFRLAIPRRARVRRESTGRAVTFGANSLCDRWWFACGGTSNYAWALPVGVTPFRTPIVALPSRGLAPSSTWWHSPNAVGLRLGGAASLPP